MNLISRSLRCYFFVLTQKSNQKKSIRQLADASLEKLAFSWLKPSKLAPASLKQDSFKRQLHWFFGSPDEVARLRDNVFFYLSFLRIIIFSFKVLSVYAPYLYRKMIRWIRASFIRFIVDYGIFSHLHIALIDIVNQHIATEIC